MFKAPSISRTLLTLALLLPLVVLGVGQRDQTPSIIPLSAGNIAAGGSVSASSELDANTTAANAIDGNLATGWRAASAAAGQTLTINLQKLYSLDKIQQTFAADGVWGFRIQGSPDNIGWATLIDKRGGIAGKTFAENVSGVYQYIRLTVTSVATDQSASSLELLVAGSDEGTNLTALPKAKATSSRTPGSSGFEAANAIDGSTSTYWGAQNDSYPQWLQVDLGEMAWVTGVEQHFKDLDKFGFVIEASPDGGGWATLVDNQAGVTTQAYQHTTRGNYRYIRVRFTSSQSGYWAASVELKVLGFPSVTLNKQVTSSPATAGHGGALAVNDNAVDYWEAASAATTQFLQVNLGGPAALHRVEQNFNSSANWKYTIQGSNNGSTWVTLVDRSAGVTGQKFIEPVTGEYRHIKLNVLPSGVLPTSREISVYGTPIERDLALHTRVLSSSHLSGYEPGKAVDGEAVFGDPERTTYWVASSNALPQTLLMDLGNASHLTRVEQSFVDSALHNFTIRGSLTAPHNTLNNPDNWPLLLDRSAGGNGKTFSATVNGEYRYLHLKITYSGGHWASSEHFKAFGIGSPVISRWWEQSGGIMRYFPKFHHQLLDTIKDGLPALKAQGYSGIDLSAVWPGPIDLWAGLAVSDFTSIDPNIGTMTDFEELIDAAHSLGMVVHMFMNPGYSHVTFEMFKKAERDHRDGIDSEERAWFDFQPNQPADPQYHIKWPWSQTANAYFYAYWNPMLPSFAWASPRWRAKAREYVKFWADKGVDGMGFDAPAVWHHNDSPAINNEVLDVVRNYDIMTNPEGIGQSGYVEWTTQWHYNMIHQLDLVGWTGCGYSMLVDAMSSQSVAAPMNLELQFKLGRDMVNTHGGTTFTPMSWERDGVPGNPACPPSQADVPINKRLLEAATLTAMGTQFFLHNGNHEIVPTDTIANWPVDEQKKLYAIIKAHSAYDGLSPSGLRVRLPVNGSGSDAKYLAYKRLNKDGTVAALIILNYQNSNQSISVNLTGSGIAVGQTPIELTTGAAGTAITSGNYTNYTVNLGNYGYTELAVEQSRSTLQGTRFESFNNAGKFWRHANHVVSSQLAGNIVPFEDSQFRIVPGLAGSGTVSFESVNFPGHYLRHQFSQAYVHNFENTTLYKQDASFTEVPGLANPSGFVSFRSLNFPTHYLRVDPANGNVRIDPGNAAMYPDATFKLVTPQ